MSRIPVILDTDPGTDIDDSWAVAFLLQSPELDLKLVTTATGDTQYRAVLAERLLEAAGRSDIPVAAGKPSAGFPGTLRTFLKDDPRLGTKHYPDAARAIVDLVMRSPEPVTVLAIAPLPNLAEALALEPAIAGKINLVGMLGSVFVKYDKTPGCDPEYNVLQFPEASKIVFNDTRWRSFTMTPLDTCGDIHLTRDAFLRLAQANPLMKEVTDSTRSWNRWYHQAEIPERTSCLFDTVAVYLAFSMELLNMKDLELACDERCQTVVRAGAQKIKTAVSWKDREAFLRLLETRLGKR